MTTDSALTIAAFDIAWASSMTDNATWRRGARFIEIPRAEFVWSGPPYPELAEDLDWIVFAGPIAARHFIQTQGSDDFPVDLRVCAAGREVADILRESHIHSDLVPARSRATGIVESMTTFEGGELRARVLVAGGARRTAELVAAISDAGGDPVSGFGYDLDRRTDSGRSRFLALAAGGAIDLVAINDAVEFEHLTELVPAEQLIELGVITESYQVYASVQEYGLKATLQRAAK